MMSDFGVGRQYCQNRTPYNEIGSLHQYKIGQGQVGRSKNRPKNRTSFMDGPQAHFFDLQSLIIVFYPIYIQTKFTNNDIKGDMTLFARWVRESKYIFSLVRIYKKGKSLWNFVSFKMYLKQTSKKLVQLPCMSTHPPPCVCLKTSPDSCRFIKKCHS